MLDVKQAAGVAYEYLKSLYPKEELVGVLLEEVELSDDRDFWFITLSFASPTSTGKGFSGLMGPQRIYKTFKVRAEDGEVVSMKIRQLA